MGEGIRQVIEGAKFTVSGESLRDSIQRKADLVRKQNAGIIKLAEPEAVERQAKRLEKLASLVELWTDDGNSEFYRLNEYELEQFGVLS